MILIGIGANLPGQGGRSALDTCIAAARALTGLPGLHSAGLSRWYESEPVPPSGQPPYVNGVARLEGAVDPAVLLAWMQAIEQEHGRQRSVANAARTLDLDLIDVDGVVCNVPGLVLPHPRMPARAFVLQPLLDVAPDWRHPVTGRSARALLAGLPPQGVCPVAPSHLRDGRDGPI